MIDLNDLRDLVTKIAYEHGFTDVTVGEDLMLMVSELAKALEDHRKGLSPTTIWYKNGNGHDVPKFDWDGKKSKPCGIPSEMADVVIRVLHFCGKHGIDIQRAVTEKIEYNRTHPYKHGKVL